MQTLKGRHLDYDDDDEHILRRLAGALMVHWDDLPEITRQVLISQATMMGDKHETVQLQQQMEMFIRNRKFS